MKKLEQTTLHPVPAENLPVKPPQLDMAALLAQFRPTAVPLHRKLYLSLKEAAEFSGLPQAYLLRKIKDGAIPAVKMPGWRIRREDLENHRANGAMTA